MPRACRHDKAARRIDKCWMPFNLNFKVAAQTDKHLSVVMGVRIEIATVVALRGSGTNQAHHTTLSLRQAFARQQPRSTGSSRR
jgi:hypothetical protein